MERWVDAVGHPSHEVSDLGRIRNKKNGYILKPISDRYGYMRLSLGSKDNVQVHRVVCESFLGTPIDDRNQVNHIDGNRKNNRLSNLEWCNAKENIRWSYETGRLDPSIGLERAIEVNKKPVRLVETDELFPSVKECAELLGVKPTNVSRCLVGSRKGQRVKGYHVEYDERGGI